ncbi:MAG: 50S ribosomal protein L13 [Candidatus Bathyarchaeota archaeon]|jgi:large subunit ribosomal protein L13
MQTENQELTIIDGKNLILGRMASLIAKRLLEGERIIIINAEKTVLSGKKRSKILAAKKYLEVGHPKKGPFHYRRPDRIVRRTVRGMLPYKKPKGKNAYRQLRVFIGMPEELQGQMIHTLAEADASKLTCPYFHVGELAREIGWNPGE